MIKIKKGTRVELKKNSKFFYQSKGNIGTTTKDLMEHDMYNDKWCPVIWDNEVENDYPVGDLIFLPSDWDE